MPNHLHVTMRDNMTGEIRVYVEDAYDGWKFQWGEGNWACDCNRHDFFSRAGGEEVDEEDDNLPCGHMRYAVLKIEDEAGNLLFGGDPRDGDHTEIGWQNLAREWEAFAAAHP